jgi:hypothetical protein
MSGHEHAGVQDPVLLGPDKFLPFEEENSDIPFVLDQ